MAVTRFTDNALYDQFPPPEFLQESEGYNKFKEGAFRKGPSQWLSMTKFKNDAQEADQREGAVRDANASTAQQLSQLASQGGVSSGARERATEAGAKNYLGMSQNLQRQGNMADMDMGIKDEQNRLSMLTQLPGLENQRSQQKNSYNMDIYKSKMEAAAAERQAQATENAGKK